MGRRLFIRRKKMEREPQKQTTDEYRNNFDAIFTKREKKIEETLYKELHEKECGK